MAVACLGPDSMARSSGPLVSVLVTTYQHAAYIAACLDGVLAQRTDFAVEVLVGEDESTDGTRAICQRYAERHPDRIRLFLRERKDVMHIGGRATGRANLLHLLGEARGTFIALCEGDDVWTDPDKLARQVAALQADPQATGCFTNVLNKSAERSTPYFEAGVTRVPPAVVTVRDVVLLYGVPTCSFLCRRSALFPLPQGLWHSPVADSLLFPHVARNGHLLYLPLVTAVRHVHAGGISSMKGPLERLRVELDSLPFIDAVSGHRYSAELKERGRKALLSAWASAIRTHDGPLARYCWRRIAPDRRAHGWNLGTTLRNGLTAMVLGGW